METGEQLTQKVIGDRRLQRGSLAALDDSV